MKVKMEQWMHVLAISRLKEDLWGNIVWCAYGAVCQGTARLLPRPLLGLSVIAFFALFALFA